MVLFTLLGSPDFRIKSSVLNFGDFYERDLVRILSIAKWVIAFFARES